MKKLTETADLNLWEFMNSRLKTEEHAWDRTKPSVCGWQLCGLILPQLDVHGFVDSLWEALFFLRSGWVVGCGGGSGGGGAREVDEGGTVVGM